MSNIRSSSLGQRIDQLRGPVTFDRTDPQADLHTDYAAIDVPVSEGAASWGPPVFTAGFDELLLLVNSTPGTATTAYTIVAQASPFPSEDDTQWYDVCERTAVTGAVTRRTLVRTVAVADKSATRVPTEGTWMRFKVWATGATPANSRITLRGIPVKRSL